MKKLGYYSAILGIFLTIGLTNCKKKRMDPCEGIECRPDQKCVEGKCVDIRKK